MKLKHFLLCVMGILIPTTVFSAEYYVVPGLRATGNDGSSWEKAITMYDIFENDAAAAKNDEYPSIKPETYSFLQEEPITMLPVPVPMPGAFIVAIFSLEDVIKVKVWLLSGLPIHRQHLQFSPVTSTKTEDRVQATSVI